MNTKTLEDFVTSIENFDSSHRTKVIYFGYYLQTVENFDCFTKENILECYDVLDYPKPANIADIFNKLQKPSKDLIPKPGGYRVSKLKADEIKKIVPVEQGRLERVYPPGHIYDFYKDIKIITLSAKKEVFVIDAYASEDIIDLYLDNLPNSIKMMILTSKENQGNFLNIAQKFKKKHPTNFKVKSNKNCHDRLFFVDKKCYVIDQSIEKAATDKPTYLCEVERSGAFRSVFQRLYDDGKTLV